MLFIFKNNYCYMFQSFCSNRNTHINVDTHTNVDCVEEGTNNDEDSFGDTDDQSSASENTTVSQFQAQQCVNHKSSKISLVDVNFRQLKNLPKGKLIHIDNNTYKCDTCLLYTSRCV